MLLLFNRHLFNIWIWRNLVFFGFFNISIWSLFWWLNRRCISILTFTFFNWLFLFHLLKETWIFILPITNCSWYGNDSLNSTIINKTSSCLNSWHFSFVIRFMIMRKLYQFPIFKSKNCSWITRICAINCVRGKENYAWCTSRLKCKTFDFLFFSWIEFWCRASHSFFHV